jgi:hypothetical protein
VAPKHKISDAINSDKHKRSHKMYPLSKKMKSLNFGKGKMSYAMVSNIYDKNKPTCEIVKKRKETASFVVIHISTVKVVDTVHDKSLVGH